MASSLTSVNVPIVDICRSELKDALTRDIYTGLDVEDGKQRSMPTLLLYDTEGLRLFEEIMGLREYYLTSAEEEVLTIHAAKIVGRLPESVQLLELGSGSVSSHSCSVTGIDTQ
jgi:uncharacterized SAM-dependent methyltransferase